MTCTATIQLGDAVSTCTYEAGHDSGMGGPHYCVSSKVTWWDESPGATPHRDPAPAYEVAESGGMWLVQMRPWGTAATFYPTFHPDPEGAAEAEAARLNGERGLVYDCEEDIEEAERERDQLQAAVNRWQELYEDSRAEANHYCVALEDIAAGRTSEGGWTSRSASEIARRTLEGLA